MRRFIVLFIIFSCICYAAGPNPAFADIITLKEGGETINGKIIKETDTELTVKLKTGGTATFPKSWVKDIKREDIPENELYTKQDIYFIKYKRLDSKSAKAQLELAEWCFKNGTAENGLFEMAERHLKIAKELNPDIPAGVDEKLAVIENMKAQSAYSVAEALFKAGSYLASERAILNLISTYPNSDYAGQAKGLLNQIWGEKRADKLVALKDELPAIASSGQELNLILNYMKEELKTAYFKKCLSKAKDFEARANEVKDEKEKLNHLTLALNCYDLTLNSTDAADKDYANSKMQELTEKFFKYLPIPDKIGEEKVVTYLGRLEDEGLVEGITSQYFKMGEALKDEAARTSQPEKAEKAISAYHCFSIAYYFSKDEGKRKEAFDKMIESQRLARELK